uniref:Uncharacterized protein n=1 Tax=Physcomitrium patens TaxID=3218 RepID=A0A2K1J8F5_PHYPA|nr:hypothetical protein PHYPA_020908 [Physcomitrium patens]
MFLHLAWPHNQRGFQIDVTLDKIVCSTRNKVLKDILKNSGELIEGMQISQCFKKTPRNKVRYPTTETHRTITIHQILSILEFHNHIVVLLG